MTGPTSCDEDRNTTAARSRRAGRRTFLVSTGVAAVGIATGGSSGPETAKDVPAAGRVDAFAVTIVSVDQGDGLVLRTADGSRLAIRDPLRYETWQPGDEAVVEIEHASRRVRSVTRMYRPIEHETVMLRRGDTLQTASGLCIDLVPSTRPRSDEEFGYVAAPLADINVGDVVGGMGYLNPRTGNLIAAQLGVRG